MAFSSKRINAYDVAQMCGVEHDEAAFVLNGLYQLLYVKAIDTSLFIMM